MRKLLVIAMISGLTVVACNNTKSPSPVEEVAVEERAASDELVESSITNTAGETLHAIFNNTRGTASFTLNGERIEMVQDTMASGIRFMNDLYEYEEWQGRITLKKEGNIIFEVNE